MGQSVRLMSKGSQGRIIIKPKLFTTFSFKHRLLLLLLLLL